MSFFFYLHVKTSNVYSLSILFFLGLSAIVLADTDWSYTHEHSQLEDDFAKVSAQARADEFKKMSKLLAVSFLLLVFFLSILFIRMLLISHLHTTLETSRKRAFRTSFITIE